MSDVIELDRLAGTLMHFLWEGAAIALFAWALMTVFRRPTLRYAIGCAGLCAMLVAPLITYAMLAPPAATGAAFVPAAIPMDAVATAMPTNDAAPFVAAEPKFSGRVRAALAAASPWIATAWLAGVAFLGLRHVVGIAAIARMRRRATAAIHMELRARLDRVARRMKFRRTITLLGSAAIEAPCVVGWIRPAILWPACAMTGLTPLQIDALLAHELAHIRRHDYLVNLLQACLETLGFYHPAVWWLSRRVRQEREHCCDEIAAEIIGDRRSYAATLVSLEMLRRGRSMLAISASGGSLCTRVKRLLTPASQPITPASIVVTVIACSVVLAGAWGCQTSAAKVMPAAITPTNDVVDFVTVPSTQPANAFAAEKDVVASAEKAMSSQPYAAEMKKEKLVAEAQAQFAEREARLHAMEADRRVVETTKEKANAAIAQKRIDETQQRLAETEAKLRATQDALQAIEASRVRADRSLVVGTPTEADLASREPSFARLLAERDAVALNLAQLQQVQGANSPQVVKQRESLATINRRIGDIAGQLAKQMAERLDGNYYVAGTVDRPGVFELGGQRVSAVQALIAAGYNTDAIASVKIVRRWPDDTKESTLYVIANVATGAGNDVSLRPGDTLLVGKPVLSVLPVLPDNPSTMPTVPPIPGGEMPMPGGYGPTAPPPLPEGEMPPGFGGPR